MKIIGLIILLVIVCAWADYTWYWFIKDSIYGEDYYKCTDEWR